MMRIARGFSRLATKSGRALRGEKPALAPVLADELVRALRVPVEDCDAETLARRVPREIRSHDGQAQNADVSQLRHMSSSPVAPLGPSLRDDSVIPETRLVRREAGSV